MAVGLAMIAAGCSDDEAPCVVSEPRTLKVAVVMEADEQPRWERTAEWAAANIREAQRGQEQCVELQLTFKSSDDSDIDTYLRQIATDPDVAAVVGPTTTGCAERLAEIFDETDAEKPMLTTTATGIEYQRRYASRPYVWNLAESDVAQIEVLMAEIAARKTHPSASVSLLAADSDNGNHNAYAEWFGFIAEEYGMKIGSTQFYRTENEVREAVRKLCGTHYRASYNALIFNPSSPEMAMALDDEIGKMREEVAPLYLYTPMLLCSDAFVDERIAAGCKHGEYEGVDLYAAPESGFHIAYRRRFGEELTNGEAQLYDALCLVAYAATLSGHSGEPLNDALLAVVDGNDGKGGSWLPADMAANFAALARGVTPDIGGVSGTLTFDEKSHSSVAGSTFRRWRLSDGEYVTTQYVSTEGSKRTSSSKNFWEWTATQMQKFDADEGDGLTYPALDERWALLVAGSTGWANYRFQADVFAMYDLLRRHGYDDEHIVLIVEDDAASHPNNPDPGTLHISDDGENLYRPEAIDYRLSSITPDDLADILQGRRSQRLPEVIGTDDRDNLFIFWSGHGATGYLDFGNDRRMTYARLREQLAATPHRKMLVAVEACYSGGLGETCTGLPGALFITAANPYETSHADVWSDRACVYLSNGFTRGFQDGIGKNPHISLRDLYYTLAQHTAGSHVKVYNAAQYGSVYSNTMEDYLE